MRLGLIILLLGGIAIALVHLRRAETAAHHEIQRLRIEQVQLRRALWEQHVRLGRLQAPAEVRRRSSEMALELTEDEPARTRFARTDPPPAWPVVVTTEP